MVFVTLFLYWQVPYPTGHNLYGSIERKINWTELNAHFCPYKCQFCSWSLQNVFEGMNLKFCKITHLKHFLPGAILIMLKRTMKVVVSWLQFKIQWIVLASLRTQTGLLFPHIPIHYGGYRSYIPCGSRSFESSNTARPIAPLKKLPTFEICKPKWKYVDQIAYFASYKPNRNDM